MECILSSDRQQLAAAIRPFRAMHHLREAKILDCTTRLPAKYAAEVKAKFGTEIRQVSLDRVVEAYNAVSDEQAQAETDRWVRQAAQIVEPTKPEIFRACKLALAFEQLLEDEKATVMTVDCYGTMWDKTIKLPAYPCLGFTRLNGMGLAGICESDLRSAMTFILMQGASGPARVHQRSDHGRVQRHDHPGPLPGHAEDVGPGQACRPVQDSARSTSGSRESCRR